MSRKKYDVKLLRNVIRFNSVIGTFPCDKKIALLILIPYFSAGGILSLATRLRHFNNHLLSIGNYFLFNCFMVTIILYSLVCVRSTWTHAITWKSILRSMESFDAKMGRNREMLTDSVFMYFKFLLANILSVLLQGITYSSEMNSIPYAISSSYLYIVNLQIFSTTLVLGIIVDMVVKRYEFLRLKTVEVYTSMNKERLFWNSLQLKDSYLHLKDILEKVNEIFGLKILLILIVTFLVILGNFQYYFFEEWGNSFTEFRVTLGFLAQLLSYWVSIIFKLF